MGAKKQRKSRTQAAPAGTKKPASSGGLRYWGYGIGLVILGFLVYWPATTGSFVLDDYDLLEGGNVLQLPGVSGVRLANRPIVMFSFLANRELTGLNPVWFHVTNIALHCLNALVLWGFLAALFRKAKLPERVGPFRDLIVYGVPALFLLTPIQSESVAYISSRSELLAGLFFLLGLWGFVTFGRSRPWVAAAAVLTCLALAVLSKQDKLTLPAIVIAMDYLLLSGCDWRGLRRNLPLYGLLGLGAVAGAFVVIRPILFATSAGFRLDWQTYAFTQLRMYFRYLSQLAWPFGLNLDPDIAPSHSLLEHGSAVALAALLLIAGVAVWKRRQAPLLVFGAVFFFVNLAPTSSFFPLLDFAAERRLYLPSIGFFLVLIGALAFLGSHRRKTAVVALVCIAAVYVVAGRQRATVWSDPLLLWQDAATKSPDKARPWTWVGRIYDSRGQLDNAVLAWERAETVVDQGSPEHGTILANLGLARARRRDYAGAVDYYQRSLEQARPRDVVWAQLGVALMRLGREEEAWAAFEKAGEGRRVSYEVLLLRAQELYLSGRYEEAIEDYQRALRRAPGDEETRRNLAIARQAARRSRQEH